MSVIPASIQQTLSWALILPFLCDAFLSRQALPHSIRSSLSASLRMDTERPDDMHVRIPGWNLPGKKATLRIPEHAASSAQRSPTAVAGSELTNMHGMPWRKSIDPSYPEGPLFFMPFWEWQTQFMEENLTNLRPIPVQSKSGEDLSYAENLVKGIRMHTVQFSCDEYKSIRLTLMDGGRGTQVFTSVWTPDPSYNLPILSCDFLQFREKKHLCIVDFQPIHDTEQEHDSTYEHLMKPVRDQFPSLQQEMTTRFFERDHFLSQQMLLGRHDVTSEGPTDSFISDVAEAYRGYVTAHVDLVQSTEPRPEQVDFVLRRHEEFDTYVADHDPAHGMLSGMFGKDFAEAYLHDVLFPLSRRRQE